MHEEDEERDHRGHTQQAELLGDHREQEIGVRLGKVEELLDARPEPDAEPFAAPEGDERVRQLVALAVRIRPRIHEPEDALQAIGRRNDEDGERAREEHREAGEEPPVEAAEEEHRHGDRRDDDEPAEVGLAQQQRRDERHHAEHRQEPLAEVVHESGLAHGVVGRVEDDEELHELRGLEARHTQRDPAPAAVHLAPEARDEHRDEERRAEEKEPRRGALPQPHGNAEERRGAGEARGDIDHMARKEIGRTKRREPLRFRHRDRGRVHHHEADRPEQQRRPQQRVVELGIAARGVVEHHSPSRAASARAAVANTSPRWP